MEISRRPFGATADGRQVTLFRISHEDGSFAEFLDYGCTLVSLAVPDRAGALVDVSLGYDTIAEYEQNNGCFGAIVGRVANRIADGSFTLDGRRYTLYRNNGSASLHGGRVGFDKYVWNAAVEDDELVFSRVSPDGEEGYPGALSIEVAYRFAPEHALSIRYCAVSDADTLCAPTSHIYFNLDGHGAGSVGEHTLRLFASRVSEVGAGLIPTGRLLPVLGTPFDFTEEKPLERDIEAPDEQLALGGGYDHNFALDEAGRFAVAAVLASPKTGIEMAVETDQPAVQLYTSNSLSHRAGKGGATYERFGGVCLETQAFPDAIHHPHLPQQTLRAGEVYTHRTLYRFAARA